MEAPPSKRARGEAALEGAALNVPAPVAGDVAPPLPLASSAALSAAPSAADQSAHVQAEDDLDDPPRAVDRDGRVVLGAAWHAESAAVLRRHGITAVLFVADADADMPTHADVVFHAAAIADDADADLGAVLPGALAFIGALPIPASIRRARAADPTRVCTIPTRLPQRRRSSSARRCSWPRRVATAARRRSARRT